MQETIIFENELFLQSEFQFTTLCKNMFTLVIKRIVTVQYFTSYFCFSFSCPCPGVFEISKPPKFTSQMTTIILRGEYSIFLFFA